jgi:CDP-glucose 4,6-dehydratase
MNKLSWDYDKVSQLHESQLLYLDNSKARKKLLWKPVLSFNETIQFTAEWYRDWIYKKKLISERQLAEYFALAQTRQVQWVL